MAKRKSSRTSSEASHGFQAREGPARDRPSRFLVAESTPDILHRGHVALICILLFLLVVWVFVPTLRNGFTNFDDNVYVTENPHVRTGLSWENVKWAFQSFERCAWHPLTWLFHMLDCQVLGLKPWGHHLTSLLLHAVNTVLVFLVLRRMTGAAWRSLFVAALFGLHPLRVESVAWVAEHKDVLSTAFWLLTLWAYTGYAQGVTGPAGRGTLTGDVSSPSDPAQVRRRSSLCYWLALVFFALGLMSKPMLVTLPFVLLVMDYWPLRRLDVATLRAKLMTLLRLLKEKAPFFVLAGIDSVVTFVAQAKGGATASLDVMPLASRVDNALVAYCRYLGKLFYPENLAVIYPLPRQWPTGTVLIAAVLLLGISVLVAVLARRHGYLLAGWLWYIGTLVPVIGLVQIGAQSMADRYTYVPLIGVAIILAWGADELTSGWRCRPVLLSAAAAGVILVCIPLTRRQIGYWRNNETLFQHAIAITENNFIAQMNLAMGLLDKGRVDDAIEHLLDARDIAPGDPDARYDLGLALFKKGRMDDAMTQFRWALALQPSHSKALYNLGTVLLQQGQVDEAIACFQKLLEAQPRPVKTLNNLGNALLQKGQVDEAIIQYRKALSIDPGYADAHNNLGNALLQKGQVDDAIGQFREACESESGFVEAHYNLGTMLLQKGRVDEAITEFKTALSIDPGYANAHNNLALALFRQGRMDEAIAHFQKALEIQPDNAPAHCNLGKALLQTGRVDDAIAHLRKALEIYPDFTEARDTLADLMLRKRQMTEPTATGQTNATPAPTRP